MSADNDVSLWTWAAGAVSSVVIGLLSGTWAASKKMAQHDMRLLALETAATNHSAFCAKQKEELLDAIRKEISRLKTAIAPTKRPDIEGCGDTSCRCRPPSGVATNGGCRCDERRVHAALDVWRRYAMELEARLP